VFDRGDEVAVQAGGARTARRHVHRAGLSGGERFIVARNQAFTNDPNMKRARGLSRR
jgi:hypothetical protein